MRLNYTCRGTRDAEVMGTSETGHYTVVDDRVATATADAALDIAIAKAGSMETLEESTAKAATMQAATGRRAAAVAAMMDQVVQTRDDSTVATVESAPSGKATTMSGKESSVSATQSAAAVIPRPAEAAAAASTATKTAAMTGKQPTSTAIQQAAAGTRTETRQEAAVAPATQTTVAARYETGPAVTGCSAAASTTPSAMTVVNRAPQSRNTAAEQPASTSATAPAPGIQAAVFMTIVGP